jgi:type I site-specific restriction-modification system R (restriction) subunit
MQAIARVNRVYGEKPGGLIVDLIGLADPLADALATYANATGDSDSLAMPILKAGFSSRAKTAKSICKNPALVARC